jgi:putative peptide zinc metalloprotease protein
MATTIFSDSWFRVSNLRVALLPSVEVGTQLFRGRTWYVLQDPYTQRYFRASAQACKFIQSLQPDRTVEEVWENYVNNQPHDAPSREEVIQLLSQLHMSNLLYSVQQSDNEAIVKRYKAQKNKELMGKLASFLFIRIPLFNPDPLLNRIRPIYMAFTGWIAFSIWALTLLWGAWAVFENWAALLDQTQGVLSVSNLPWLYISLATLKLFHETGHAFVCKRFGGEVRTVGVMFLLFTPLPYVDASSSSGFPNRWHRIYVSFAGMGVEFFFAAVGAVIWANTGPGVIHSLAFNVMLIGSVSSLLFNGNPLLRFDAYYMLSDYAEIPNLYQKGQQQWKYFGDRYLLGTIEAVSKATDRKEWVWITTYGLLSFLYLILITIGITLFLMDMWLPLGLLVLAMTLYSKVLAPCYQLFKHLRGSATQGNRQRAVSVVGAIGLGMFFLLAVVPFPDATRAQGIIKANSATNVYAQTAGKLDQLHIQHGERVKAGQVLASYSNPDLEAEIRLVESAQVEAQMQLRQAMHQVGHDLSALQRKADVLELRRLSMVEQFQRLQVRAAHDGEWVAPTLHEQLGTWMQAGQALGEVVDASGFRFVAVMRQEQADIMFKNNFRQAELRLAGQSEIIIDLPKVSIIPFQSDKLPSTALGWSGGGEIAVNTQETSGTKAMESFYLLQAAIPSLKESRESTVYHGLSGTLRLKVPARPLASQAYRAVDQLVQKRYAL